MVLTWCFEMLVFVLLHLQLIYVYWLMSILPNTMKVIGGAGQVATLWGQFITIILCTVFVLSHNFVLSSFV